MGDTAVLVEGLHKRYRLGGFSSADGLLTSALAKGFRRLVGRTEGQADPEHAVWALRDVSSANATISSNLRDNVYLSGAILGMKRDEITRKFDEIVAFAEVERFIDTPVKHYSSGMYVRLGFSV